MEDFTIERHSFSVSIDSRTNTPYIRSIHPYDETEYHWARQRSSGNWDVFRSGKRMAMLSNMSFEDVAKKLLSMDRNANLCRTGGIW